MSNINNNEDEILKNLSDALEKEIESGLSKEPDQSNQDDDEGIIEDEELLDDESDQNQNENDEEIEDEVDEIEDEIVDDIQINEIKEDFFDLERGFEDLKPLIENNPGITEKLENFVLQTRGIIENNFGPIENLSLKLEINQEKDQKEALKENREITNKAVGQIQSDEKPNEEKLSPLEEFLKKQRDLVNRIEIYMMEKKAKEKEKNQKEENSLSLANPFFDYLDLEKLPESIMNSCLDFYKNVETPEDFVEAIQKNQEYIDLEIKEIDSDLKKINLIEKKLENDKELKGKTLDFLKEKVDENFEDLSKEEQIEKFKSFKENLMNVKSGLQSLKEGLNRKLENFNEKSGTEKEEYIQKSFVLNNNNTQKTQDESKIQEVQNQIDKKPLLEVLNEQQNLNNLKTNLKQGYQEQKSQNNNEKAPEKPINENKIDLELQKIKLSEQDRQKIKEVSNGFADSLIKGKIDQKQETFQEKVMSSKEFSSSKGMDR